MEHSEVINNDIIDQYILHMLSEEKESEFEEHLLFCTDCQAELEKRMAVTEIIREKQIENLIESDTTIQVKSPSRFFSPFILKIAASIVVILSVLWIIKEFSGNNHPKVAKKISSPDFGISKRNLKKEENKTPIIAQHIEDSFKELPMMENFIKNQVRAEQIEVISPKINQKAPLGATLVFKWKGELSDSLNLVIFDNKANIIFEVKIDKNYSFSEPLKMGLYYWQLETSKEALFTSKFEIVK